MVHKNFVETNRRREAVFYWKEQMTETISKNFQQWTGDGATTAFTMSSVNVQDDTHLAVYVDDTLQTITTHYTVGIVSQIATVTFLSAPANATQVTIVREEPLEQNTDLTTINTFRAEGFEGALDSIVRQIYRLWHKLTRSLTLPDTDVDGSGQYDANSNRIGNLGDPTADQDAVTKAFAENRYALQSGGGGDMFKASYDSNNDGKVNSADTADAVPWSGVTSKPSVFTPDTHSHTVSDITDLATVATSGDYDDLSNKPTIPVVDDAAYGAGWNGDTDAPTKNAVYDKIETIGGGGSSIEVEDEGSSLTTGVTKFNFVGSGVTATESSDEVTVTVAGGGAPVDSVNGATGVVVLDPDDLDDTATTNKFTTDAEISKLSGIETGATADQTGAQIKTAYEAEANAFTDAQFTKLAAIQASADVTDATNVAAAGAVMNTGAETIAGVKTFSSDPLIPDEVYGAGWNGSLEPPTKNAVYDKIETIGGGSSAWTEVADNAALGSVATLDITGLAAYDEIEIWLFDVEAGAANEKLEFLLSDDNGSTFESTGYIGRYTTYGSIYENNAWDNGSTLRHFRLKLQKLPSHRVKWEGGMDAVSQYFGEFDNGNEVTAIRLYTTTTTAVVTGGTYSVRAR